MLYILISKGLLLGSSLLVLLLNWPKFQLVFREAQKTERAVCFFSFVGRVDCSFCWCWFVCVWVLVIFTHRNIVSMEYQLMERKKSFCLLAGQLPAFSLEYWVFLAIYLKITNRRVVIFKSSHLLLLLLRCHDVHRSCWRVWTLTCLCFQSSKSWHLAGLSAHWQALVAQSVLERDYRVQSIHNIWYPCFHWISI